MEKEKVYTKSDYITMCYSYASNGIITPECLDKIFKNNGKTRRDNKDVELPTSRIIELLRLLELRKQKKINRRILRASIFELFDFGNYAKSEVAYKRSKGGEFNINVVQVRQKDRRCNKIM
jgi:hypothetical protein